MKEHCSRCGGDRLIGFSGHRDRRCRRCGTYFPLTRGGPAPSFEEQFNGAWPFVAGTSLKIIIRAINSGLET